MVKKNIHTYNRIVYHHYQLHCKSMLILVIVVVVVYVTDHHDNDDLGL